MVGSGGSLPLGSNDLPSDTNYPQGETPRDIYISRYEAILEKSPNDLDATKRLGIVFHHQGVIGVDGMPEKALAYLTKAQELSPDDNETLAFLGSAMTLIARDSWNPYTKLTMVNDGIDKMDQAVEREPKNILIRMVRANNSLNLPSFLKRNYLAKADFLYIEKIANDPEADFGLPSDYGDNDSKDVLANTYYKLGMIFKQEGNKEMAVQYFKKSTEAWPESRWAKGSLKELERYPQ